MRLCTGIRRSPGSIRRDIAGYLNVHDLEGLFHCIAGGVRDLCGQTARPRLLPQMEAAVEAVEAVGLNQVKVPVRLECRSRDGSWETSGKNTLECLLIGRASENFLCPGNGFPTAQVEFFEVNTQEE